MDELKAFVLVAAVAVRLWWPSHERAGCWKGSGGSCIVAAAISLTTFMRRPEYAAATGAAVAKGRRRLRRGVRRAQRRRAVRRWPSCRGGRTLRRPLPELHCVRGARQPDGPVSPRLPGDERRLRGRARCSPSDVRSGAGRARHEGDHRGRRTRPAAWAGDRRDPQVHGRSRRARRSCTGSSMRWPRPEWTTWSSCAATAAIGSRSPVGGPPLRFVENPDWAENNILTSLLYAEREMADGFLFSYSDIVFAPEHARRLAEAPGPVGAGGRSALARRLRGAHAAPRERGRAGAGRGDRRRRARSPASASGWCRPKRPPASSSVWRAFRPRGPRRCARSGARRALPACDAPFGAAATLAPGLPQRRAQRARRRRGVALRPLFIDGLWREIDTEEDLARAETTRSWPTWAG